MQSPPRIDVHEPAPREPDGPIVEVRLRGEEVLLATGGNALVSPLTIADRAAVAAALSGALAMTLTALATDVIVLTEPSGTA